MPFLDAVSASVCVGQSSRWPCAPFEDCALRLSVACGELPDVLPMRRGGTFYPRLPFAYFLT